MRTAGLSLRECGPTTARPGPTMPPAAALRWAPPLLPPVGPRPRESSPHRLGRRRQADMQCFHSPHLQLDHLSDQVEIATFTRRLYLNSIRASGLAAGPRYVWWVGPACVTSGPHGPRPLSLTPPLERRAGRCPPVVGSVGSRRVEESCFNG